MKPGDKRCKQAPWQTPEAYLERQLRRVFLGYTLRIKWGLISIKMLIILHYRYVLDFKPKGFDRDGRFQYVGSRDSAGGLQVYGLG